MLTDHLRTFLMLESQRGRRGDVAGAAFGAGANASVERAAAATMEDVPRRWLRRSIGLLR
ncbi:hypothetical protein SE91_28110 [Bradyrhizobium sp. DOA1]|nr:hypothetical protein SE91_28110 [Bradyrhizobium sp. DOA1]